jgi:hypothetical protein
MSQAQSNLNSNRKSHRVILVTIIALVALTSALKDLRQAHHLIADVAEVVSEWSDAIVPTASARTKLRVVRAVAVETRDVTFVDQSSKRSADFRWNGPVAPGNSIEIKGLNGDIAAEAGSGNEVQVVATKTSRRSDVDSVQIRVVQHEHGVTICALYPTESGDVVGDCEGGSGRQRNSNNNGVNNNDVRVDFIVKVPARVGFIGKTVNGDIAATSLSGNVITKTVNGSIRISTTGYAEATTINGEISARLGDASWSTPLNFKTLNGAINLDLPANLSADIDAETLNGSINSDFPINLISVKDRKHLRGRIGSGGRELFLKTLNGSINLRLAG